MTIEELKDKKTTLGLTNEMIASSAGIPLSTVQKIMSGATKAPDCALRRGAPQEGYGRSKS